MRIGGGARKGKVCGWLGKNDGEDVNLVNCELMTELRKTKRKMYLKSSNEASLNASTILLPQLFRAF